MADTLIILTDRLAGLRRQNFAGLADELFSKFIQTHQRTLRIARSRINFQHVLHGTDEGRMALRRQAPLLDPPGFQLVFLRTLPMVLGLTLSTRPSATT